MKKYNISINLIRVIHNFYDKAAGAVLFKSSIGDWFRITVAVRQGCLLSLILFNIFLERITTDALEDHEGTVSIDGRTITNLRFADNIDGLAGEEELAKLVERLGKSSTAYGMEISAQKAKLMTNNTSGINTEIKVNGQKLETVTSFKYLSSVTTEPRHLKLVTVSNFRPFTVISVLMPLVLFVTSLVFSALISMP